jgi:hypothetical protein
VHVFATARTVSKMSGLADAGCTLVPLDVTDAASVADAAAKVAATTGGRGVDVLVRERRRGQALRWSETKKKAGQTNIHHHHTHRSTTRATRLKAASWTARPTRAPS